MGPDPNNHLSILQKAFCFLLCLHCPAYIVVSACVCSVRSSFGPTLWRNGVRKAELLVGAPSLGNSSGILVSFRQALPRTAATKPPVGPFPLRDSSHHNSCD